MAVYKRSVCDTVFDEEKEGKKWEELAEEWNCHVCESGKKGLNLQQDMLKTIWKWPCTQSQIL